MRHDYYFHLFISGILLLVVILAGTCDHRVESPAVSVNSLLFAPLLTSQFSYQVLICGVLCSPVSLPNFTHAFNSHGRGILYLLNHNPHEYRKNKTL